MSALGTDPFSSLKVWLEEHGGGFHQDTDFKQDTHGSRVIATKDLDKDTTVVSCPFSLIITQTLAKKAVTEILDDAAHFKDVTWTERQWISTYITLHWIIGPENSAGKGVLAHFPYLNTLPSSEKLRTPLHFTPTELDLFKGTNLYGATQDREREWKSEWEQCQAAVSQVNNGWGDLLTWDKYLTAATYLSSRAFPSSLLSERPTLVATPSTEPILIPGVDALNHARAQPVSWVVNHREDPTKATSDSTISLIQHSSTAEGQEIFNNYGPKPNAELILGYGFSIPNNPDDTILLKVGGVKESKWEVGREARGADALWKEILSAVQSEPSDSSYEDLLDASGMLQEMVQTLIDRSPNAEIPEGTAVRAEVASQNAILRSLLVFARSKEQEAVDIARQEGINIIIEDE
ncbi:hypothetical protein CVT26_013937 [Gymnopilus dilepis]|uniref:Uncharacterized protein n=1 Tax=Gymnopilus dilepis TaxID=231916 RepID=A0A409VW28_9AGAR|nr:hypothetical protein CVT26_013937 [Gymnopilus dilepis]